MSRAGTAQRARQATVCQAQSAIRCPFANFGISPPAGKAKPKPSPLDQTDSPNTVGANFWLAAGKPGQDVPGKLVSGIHRLYEVSSSAVGVTFFAEALGLLFKLAVDNNPSPQLQQDYWHHVSHTCANITSFGWQEIAGIIPT